MVDETKLVRGFKKHVSILYGAHILKKDESFLLQHHFAELSHKKGPNKINLNSLIQKIKEYWSNMVPENKVVVWKYLRVLHNLSDKWNIAAGSGSGTCTMST